MLHKGQLETTRLAVRPFRKSDAADLVAMFADPRVHQFVGSGTPLTMDEAVLWVTRSNENLATHGYGTGAVVERHSQQMIGWAGFARPEGMPEEIIYGFGPEHWGRGYGRELLSALAGYAETELHKKEIRATVDRANVASIHLLTQHGFVISDGCWNGDPECILFVRSAADDWDQAD